MEEEKGECDLQEEVEEGGYCADERSVHTHNMVGRARNKGRKDKLVKKKAADPSFLYI